MYLLLFLTDNGTIGNVGFADLIDSLAANSTVSKLLLDGCLHHLSSFKRVSQMLEVNQSLKTIRWPLTSVDNPEKCLSLFFKLTRAMRTNQHLQRYSFDKLWLQQPEVQCLNVTAAQFEAALAVRLVCSRRSTSRCIEKLQRSAQTRRDQLTSSLCLIRVVDVCLARNRRRLVQWQHERIVEIALSLFALPCNVPPYVVLEIIDFLPIMNDEFVLHGLKIALVSLSFYLFILFWFD